MFKRLLLIFQISKNKMKKNQKKSYIKEHIIYNIDDFNEDPMISQRTD